MDGDIADLKGICDLAEKYDAMVMVDDCHATGFVGKTGRGTPEHCGVQGRVDIITSTLGKALGGASGGFTAASQEIVDLLRQRSRPYLFSNTRRAAHRGGVARVPRAPAPRTTELRDRLEANTKRFREAMTAAGFDIRPGVHPIVPIMLGDARLSVQMADAMLAEGIYVIGFSYPVVPKGQARIRVAALRRPLAGGRGAGDRGVHQGRQEPRRHLLTTASPVTGTSTRSGSPATRTTTRPANGPGVSGTWTPSRSEAPGRPAKTAGSTTTDPARSSRVAVHGRRGERRHDLDLERAARSGSRPCGRPGRAVRADADRRQHVPADLERRRVGHPAAGGATTLTAARNGPGPARRVDDAAPACRRRRG